MSNRKNGFTAVYAILAVLAVLVIGGVGYAVYQNNHKTVTVTVKKTTVYTGPTAAVDTANNNEITSETATDSQSTTTDQSTATSTDQAATNVGGAYDASAY